MNNTSLGSRFVRSAARSPGRSSTGPEVWRRFTPISRAMIWASVVFPRPGGPNSSTWSSASARLFAASTKISSCPRTLSCPTYSARGGGRSDRSNCSSCAVAGLAEISRSVSTLTRAFCQSRRRRAAWLSAAGKPERKGRPKPPFFQQLLGTRSEPVLRGDTEDVDVRIGVIALPFGAHADVLRDVVAHAQADGPVVARVLVGHAEVGRQLGLDARNAELRIRREPGRADRVRTHADQLPGIRLHFRAGASARPARVRLHFAEIRIGELGGDIAVELVSAVDPPCGVLVVAGNADGRGG